MGGVHVILDIAPRQIDADAWADVFEETRRLIEGHPARLLGYGFRAVAGVRVPVFTRGVVQGDGGERKWCVVGDRATLGTGERQRMYRDLGRYVARCPAGAARSDADDILLAPGLSDGAAPPMTVRVFGEGEQSEPCRMALLAAAIVVETRFPRHALVSGRFDRDQAEAARRWAEGILGPRLALPVRVDAFRLVERLGARLEGEALVRVVDRLILAEPGARDRALDVVFGPNAARLCAAARAADGPTETSACVETAEGADLAVASPGELDARQRDRVQALASAVRETRARVEDHGGPVSVGAARRTLASLLAKAGPVLTEDAWDWILREEDRELCAFLAALATLAPADADQAGLRRVLLENRALCRYAAGVGREEASSGPSRAHATEPEAQATGASASEPPRSR